MPVFLSEKEVEETGEKLEKHRGQISKSDSSRKLTRLIHSCRVLWRFGVRLLVELLQAWLLIAAVGDGLSGQVLQRLGMGERVRCGGVESPVDHVARRGILARTIRRMV